MSSTVNLAFNWDVLSQFLPVDTTSIQQWAQQNPQAATAFLVAPLALTTLFYEKGRRALTELTGGAIGSVAGSINALQSLFHFNQVETKEKYTGYIKEHIADPKKPNLILSAATTAAVAAAIALTLKVGQQEGVFTQNILPLFNTYTARIAESITDEKIQTLFQDLCTNFANSTPQEWALFGAMKGAVIAGAISGSTYGAEAGSWAGKEVRALAKEVGFIQEPWWQSKHSYRPYFNLPHLDHSLAKKAGQVAGALTGMAATIAGIASLEHFFSGSTESFSLANSLHIDDLTYVGQTAMGTLKEIAFPSIT